MYFYGLMNPISISISDSLHNGTNEVYDLELRSYLRDTLDNVCPVMQGR
jgi:hypothetical protein